MNDFEQYRESFLEGFYFSISEDILICNTPKVDYSDFKSIGYYDGYIHGRKNLAIGRKKIITNLLEDYIHNYYAIALHLHKNYNDKYVWYKDGFVMGVSDAREKCVLNDVSFSATPNLDDSDIHSIGYYDGYCYFLNEIISKKSKLENNDKEENKVPVEVSARECYKNSFSKYSIFTNTESKKMG